MKKALLLLLVLSTSLLVHTQAVAAQNNGQLEIVLLNQDPDPAEQGEYIDVRWKVNKLGEKALNNIEFELIPEYPFSIDENEDPIRKLGDWIGFSEDEDYAILHYKLFTADKAIEDSYEVELRYRYDGSGWVSQKFDLLVGEKNTPNFVLGTIISSPRKLTSNIDEAQLDVEIANIGNGDAENVQIEIDFPEGFEPSYSFADRDNLGTITAGESKTATFYVDIDKIVKSGDHQASITIKYKDANDEEHEYKKNMIGLEIPLHKKPFFEVEDVSFSSENIGAGEEVTMTVTVRNIGDQEAESTSLRIFKESSQPFDFEEKTDYIGKVLPGESGTATLTFMVEDGASPKEYLMDIELRSIANDEVVTNDEMIRIPVMRAKTNPIQDAIMPIAGIILLVIVAFVSYRTGKNRHKKK